MNKLNYAVIGNNWGNRINKILKNSNRNSFIVNLNYKEHKFEHYLDKIKNILLHNKVDIVWLAIPPINQYEICKHLINFKFHLIIEKPLIFNFDQKK